MVGTIYIEGVIGEDTNLLDVIRQVKAQKHATEYLIKIDSVGGLVSVGYDIYNYLRGLEKPVTTYTTKSYSIASMVFLAGSKRIIPENTSKAIMIHLPWTEVRGTADLIERQAIQMRNLENEFFHFYSQALDIKEEAIQALLTNETYLDATQALEMGFATDIQPIAKAVAMINNDTKEEQSLMTKVEQKISAIYNKLFGVRAELILQDATGVEVNFPDLADGDLPEQGAKATIDGKPADGEILLPDGSKLIFEAGLVKEIVPAEVPEEEAEPENAENDEAPTEGDAPADAKDEKIAALEAENAELKAKIAELEGTQASAELKEDEQAEKMIAILAKLQEKSDEHEARYQALAKQIGSDFQPNTIKENTPAIKAQGEETPKFSIKRK